VTRPVSTWQAAVAAAGRHDGFDVLADAALTALQQEIPALQEDPDLLEAARSSTLANIALTVELVQGNLKLGQLETPPQAVVFARELARRNVPVAQLDRAYRAAQLALWRWSVAQVRRHLEGDVAAAIEGLSEAVLATGDVFSSAVMERYALERERWLRSADALRAETVQELLAGGPVDVTAASSRLRYELRQTHQAFVVWTDGDGGAPESVAVALSGPRALLHPVGVGVVAGWVPEGGLDVQALAEGFRLALGASAPGEAGFRRSHEEALEARRVARLLRRAEAVTHYDEVALLALLTKDPEQAERFARDTLGRLAASDSTSVRLADTLHAALEEQGSPRRTAHRLGIHENTAAKRLRAVEELLGGLHDRRTADLLAALTILPAVRLRPPE